MYDTIGHFKELDNITKEEGIGSALKKDLARTRRDLEILVEDVTSKVVGGTTIVVAAPYFIYKFCKDDLRRQRKLSQCYS